MTDFKDNIRDDEIRVIGEIKASRVTPLTSPSPRGCGWRIVGIIVLILLVAGIVLAYLFGFNKDDKNDSPNSDETASYFEPQTTPAPKAEPHTIVPLGFYPDSPTTAYTQIIDTTINDIPLRIHIPHGAIPSLQVGRLNENDSSIILVAQAADIRRDNRKIVGAFVLQGKPLAWGKAKTGFCAIIHDTITVGIAENSPLFEKATETDGYFFRQYPLVDNGRLVENEPKNKSIRRSLCDRNGEIMVIETLSAESFHDFAQALEDLDITNAIYLVGSHSYGWSTDAQGHRHTFGRKTYRMPVNTSYILWRKP